MSVALLKKFFDLAKLEDKKCSICLDNVDTYNEAYITFNCCAYIFHTDCIKRSIDQVNNKCPICNKELLLVGEHESESESIYSNSEYEQEDYSQNEIFLKNFTHVHACNCNGCVANDLYFRLKFSIIDDNLYDFTETLSFLNLNLINYNCEYTDKIFLFTIEYNSYSILNYLIENELIDEYPDSDESMEIFHQLAELKNYKMLTFLADWSIDSLPTLIGYDDPEINCILGYTDLN